MLTQEEDVDAHALRRRGWSISAIARHLGKDRKTIRAYLNGERTAGVRSPAGPDVFEPFVTYCRERLVEDPHLWATALYDELLQLGYDRSYPRLTHNLRTRGLRPVRHACRPGRRSPRSGHRPPAGRGNPMGLARAARPTQELGRLRSQGVPAGRRAGPLEQVAGVLAEAMDQPQLIDAQHQERGPARRADPGLAVRPDGHRRAPGHRQGHRLLRRGRQALWGTGQTVPTAAGQPQGCGREGQPHRGATMVAHPAHE